MDKHKRSFFGKKIDPDNEKKIIEKLLKKFRSRTVSSELKKEIFETLTEAKEKGIISIPFKVIMRCDATKTHRDTIEILLETQL